ncbi:response regulator [Chitinimonas lacunae]|uniref:Response regulator n=1 Tax=Chitinimonas lacunae TaxID=1963018 RepID=A0ABV8MQP6_9NEIS
MTGTAEQRCRVVVADDHLLVRMGIRAVLEHLGGYEVVGEASDGVETMTSLAALRPEVVLVDIAMPELSGIEVVRLARTAYPDLKLLCLSALRTPEAVIEALAAGANGYLLKDFVLDELAVALGAVRNGERFLSPSLPPEVHRLIASGRQGDIAALTARQIEVLKRVAEGKTTKQIARELDISPKTVEFHRAKLAERLGLHDVASLTLYAARAGLTGLVRDEGTVRGG